MPQLDNIAYLPQIFWLFRVFTLWYVLSSSAILPALLQTINSREWMLGQTNSEGSSATSSILGVFQNVIGSFSNSGENESTEHARAVVLSGKSLVTGSCLKNSIQSNDNVMTY